MQLQALACGLGVTTDVMAFPPVSTATSEDSVVSAAARQSAPNCNLIA